MRITKKAIAVILTVLMAISMMPFTAFAAPPGSSDTGTGTGGISIGGGSTVVGEEPYLTFTGTDSFSIKTNNSMKNWDGTLEYSTDANTWTKWNGASQISSDNNVLYLRGTGNTIITGSNSSKYWVITTQGTVACSGDIRTLLNYDEPDSSSMGNYCFSNLFYNCTSLTAAPELPATILAEHCYSYMFNGCTSLTMAPELPATMLAYACYYNMFNGCTSLTTAPELPSTSLAQFCYANMFNGCTSLTTAPELPATSLAPSCYNSMFQGCTSLTTAPELWATTLTYACYCNMFNGCANLTTAPELPANDLAGRCYYNMFRDCTSLTTPSELWATDLTEGCYYGMFQGCTGIKLSTEQTAEYSAPYSIPKEGTAESVGYDALTNMFTGTGGTFTGTPTINTTYYIPGSAPTEPEPTVTWDAATENIQIGWDCNQLNPYDASYTKDAITVSATSEEGHTFINGTSFQESFMGNLSGFVFTNSVANFSKIKLVFTDLSIVGYNQFFDSEYNVDPNWSSDLDSKTVTWEGDSNSVGLYAYGVEGTLDRIEFTYEVPVPSAYAGYVPAATDDADALAAKAVKFNGYDWYLIEDNSTSETEGTVTLLAADTSFGTKSFDNENLSNKYSTSQVKAYLDDMTETGGAFADVADAIETVTVTTDNDTDVTAKLYLLSKSEAGALPANVLMLDNFTNADFYGEAYWLRSPNPNNGMDAAYVSTYDGTIHNGSQVYRTFGVRPALQLDLSKVEFDSETKTFALPTPAPTSTVSFTKVSSADEITAENIGTCTMEEAKAWALANWDDVHDDEKFIDVAYYNSSTGRLIVFVISPNNDKNAFENNYENFIYEDSSAENIKNWFKTYGDTVYLCTVAAPAEPNNGTNITVADTISENFYLDESFYGADSYVAVNYNHNSNVSETADFQTDIKAMASLAELNDATSPYDGARILSVLQAPAQSTETITINVYPTEQDAIDGTNAIGNPIEYSVYTYCRQIIEGDYAANLKALAKSTLDYAAAAQLFFNYNTDEMATKDNANNAFYGEVAGADLTNVAGPSALATGIEQVSVVVKSDLEINLLSRNKINVTGYNLETTKGGTRFKATSVEEKNGDFYVIHIEGIEPDNMDNTITVNTDCGNIVMTANSVMKAMAGSNDEKMVTLAKAMYLYSVAANNYFA